MTKIQIRKVNGVPMGREITDKVVKWGTFSGEYLEDYEDTAFPAPGCEEGEAEGDLQYQFYDTYGEYWADCSERTAELYCNGCKVRAIWRIVSTPEKVEVKEVLTVEQIVDEVILQTLNDLYFLGQLRESESHIVRNQFIAERKKKILDKLSPPTH